jgi:hypothetical protein
MEKKFKTHYFLIDYFILLQNSLSDQKISDWGQKASTAIGFIKDIAEKASHQG